jgi:hypothetical protein
MPQTLKEARPLNTSRLLTTNSTLVSCPTYLFAPFRDLAASIVHALTTTEVAEPEQTAPTPAPAQQTPLNNSNTHRSAQDARVCSVENNIDELTKKLGDSKLLAQARLRKVATLAPSSTSNLLQVRAGGTFISGSSPKDKIHRAYRRERCGRRRGCALGSPLCPKQQQLQEDTEEHVHVASMESLTTQVTPVVGHLTYGGPLGRSRGGFQTPYTRWRARKTITPPKAHTISTRAAPRRPRYPDGRSTTAQPCPHGTNVRNPLPSCAFLPQLP